MRLGGTAPGLALAGVLLLALSTAGPAAPRIDSAASAAPASGPVPVTSARQASDTSCDAKASPYRPLEDPNGPTIKAIEARGVINIGVDLTDYRWGYLGPDGQPAGFDDDLARAIAQSLPGNPKINWIALDDDQRIPRLNSTGSDHVDLVVHTMTITCERRSQVDLSTVYYEAGQRVLVPSAQLQPGEDGTAAMKGGRVCVASNSTASDLLDADRKLPKGQQQFQESGIVRVDTALDCLVDLQLGTVDAVLTDDAVAYGLAAQDPQTAVVGGKALSDEPYGVAVPKGADDLAAWVNQVLENYRRGPWQASYDHWLKPYVPGQPEPTPPPAEYSN